MVSIVENVKTLNSKSQVWTAVVDGFGTYGSSQEATRTSIVTVVLMCLDIDECSTVRGICANGHCVNNPGSYVCECVAGFRPSQDRSRCIGESIHRYRLV